MEHQPNHAAARTEHVPDRTDHVTRRALRIAVAQTTVPEDPGDQTALRASGREIRNLMRQAADTGARLVQFPEGALVYPHKLVMSSTGPDRLGPADWDRAAWDVLREEAEAITRLAGELRLWTAFGSIHPLTTPNRPHNSLYIASDHGRLVHRYDKRRLSHTELTWMYTPGTNPLVFTIDDITFGVALCVEAHFPDLIAAYERAGVDCLLLSVMVDDPARAVIAQAYASLHCLWVGYSLPAQYSAGAQAGLIAPGGRWLARCPADGQPALAIADIDPDSTASDIDIAVRLARPWRRTATSSLYQPHARPCDPRSSDRTCL